MSDLNELLCAGGQVVDVSQGRRLAVRGPGTFILTPLIWTSIVLPETPRPYDLRLCSIICCYCPNLVIDFAILSQSL